jgi:hypothetical protein
VVLLLAVLQRLKTVVSSGIPSLSASNKLEVSLWIWVAAVCCCLLPAGQGGKGRKMQSTVTTRFAGSGGFLALALRCGAGRALIALSVKLPRWKISEFVQEGSPLVNKHRFLRCGGLMPLLVLLAGDEGMTPRVLMFSIPAIGHERSLLEGYMKPARPNTPTWSRSQKTPCKP